MSARRPGQPSLRLGAYETTLRDDSAPTCIRLPEGAWTDACIGVGSASQAMDATEKRKLILLVVIAVVGILISLLIVDKKKSEPS
jgi:hypothetical protein